MIKEFSKVTGYKSSRQKSIVFLYTVSKHAETEIENTIAVTTTQKMGYLGTHLTNYVEDRSQSRLRTCCLKHPGPGSTRPRDGWPPSAWVSPPAQAPRLLDSTPGSSHPVGPGLAWKSGRRATSLVPGPTATGWWLQKGDWGTSGRCSTRVWKPTELRWKETEARLLSVL